MIVNVNKDSCDTTYTNVNTDLKLIWFDMLIDLVSSIIAYIYIIQWESY